MEPNPSNNGEPTPETPVTETPAPVETPVVAESAPVTEPTPVTSEPVVEPTPQQVPVADPAASVVAPAAVNPGRGLGIASLVLSIIGVHLIGLILGIVGLNKSKKAGQKNGLALAGIIIGAIGLVIGVIVAIVLISVAGQLVAQCADLGAGTHMVNGVTITCK